MLLLPTSPSVFNSIKLSRIGQQYFPWVPWCCSCLRLAVVHNPTGIRHLSHCRTTYVLADVMDDQLKPMWFSPFQAEEIETDLDMVRGFINVTEGHLNIRVNLS